MEIMAFYETYCWRWRTKAAYISQVSARKQAVQSRSLVIGDFYYLIIHQTVVIICTWANYEIFVLQSHALASQPFDHQSPDNDILAINKEILLALTLAYFLFPNARSSIFASKILDLFLLRWHSTRLFIPYVCQVGRGLQTQNLNTRNLAAICLYSGFEWGMG